MANICLTLWEKFGILYTDGDFMLKRKAYNELVEWKNSHKRNCLLVVGARQIGKTYIIREFAKDNYKNFYEFNFLTNPEFIEVFDGALDAQTILRKLSLYTKGFEIDPKNTIIFLDEIQECPNAITALKFLAEDESFDCVASGSMLGIAYKRTTSFPVGYVNFLYMNSLDFEEFCWANGITEESITYLKTFFEEKKTVDSVIHNRFLELFKEYIVLGGMPNVVNEFIANQNYQSAFKIQKDILLSYKQDVAKYASPIDGAKILDCFNSIPAQLAREQKKFKYGLVEKGANKDKYFGALEWLKDAGIINICYNLRSPEAPFEGNKNLDCFKLYMSDTGLLMAMFDDESKIEVLKGNLSIYKGAIYENVIADILHKLGKELYYFEYNSTLEIDFFIWYNGIVTAVEVKSADNTKSKSLNSIMNNWGVEQGIKLSSKNLGISKDNNVISLPIYMAMFL